MFCKHKDEIIETYRFESEIGTFEGRITNSLAIELSKRGVITVVQCDLCKRIKHLKTVI